MNIVRHHMLVFLLFLTGVLAIFQVVTLNRDSTTGEKLRNILVEIEEVKKENNRLSQKIASASSLATIAVKAQHSGLTPIKETIAISTSLPLALSQ